MWQILNVNKTGFRRSINKISGDDFGRDANIKGARRRNQALAEIAIVILALNNLYAGLNDIARSDGFLRAAVQWPQH